MININLPTGKTISVSTFEFFSLRDEDIQEFYQTCLADDLGVFIENPFSQRTYLGQIVEDEQEEDFI